jgi:hypothetical protein
MKPTTYRRIRRHPAARETVALKKDNQREQQFFGEPVHEPFFKPFAASHTEGNVQRKCAECEKEEMQSHQNPNPKDTKVQPQNEKKEDEKIMKKADEKEKDKIQKKENAPATATTTSKSANYIASIDGKGQAMSATSQSFFGSRMGYDFSDVKVHTGKEASDSAKELNAKAYTIGSHVVFGEGQYNQESAEGKKLMAHELTHVLQQNSENQLRRKSIPEELEKEKSGIPTFSEHGVVEQNTRHFGDCNGVSVEGHTDANYGNSYTSPGTSRPASDCTECSGEDCVVNTGTVVSVFTANPQITLPSVPSGLNECEQNAVQQFINTTLRAHELQHVAAFNTYRGTVRTPYTYRGCASGLDAYTQQIHDNIESARKTASDARSSALDANGANIFNVPCNCPDPEPENGKTND